VWRIWHHGDQEFLAQPGDKVYVFFRIFSPTRFSDQVQLRWYLKEDPRGWTLQDTIPIKILGGRAEGFRGYGFKSNYQPGEWKVQVETTDGREIGRVYFHLRPAPSGRGISRSTSSSARRKRGLSIGRRQAREQPLQCVDLREVAGEIVVPQRCPSGWKARRAYAPPRGAAEVDERRRDPASARASPLCARACSRRAGRAARPSSRSQWLGTTRV